MKVVHPRLVRLRARLLRVLQDRAPLLPAAQVVLRSPVLLVGVMTLPVGVVAVLRGALTAKYFGVDLSVDALTAAQALALFLVNVAGSTLGAVSVPEVARSLSGQSRQDSSALTYSLLFVGVLKFMAISVIVLVVAPLYVSTVGAHFDLPTRDLCIRLIYISAVFLFFSAASAQASAILNLLGRYAGTALSQLFVPSAACFALLVFQSSRGIEVLAWGLVIGAALQFFTLAASLLGILGRPTLRLYEIKKSFSLLGRQYGFLALGAALVSASPFIDVRMVAKVGPGSVALLAYGGLIPTLAAAFIASAVAGPALSAFSRQITGGRFKAAIAQLNLYAWLCLTLTGLLAVILFTLTPGLVNLLFIGGEVSAEDGQIISDVQVLLLLHVPFYVAGVISGRVLIALRRNQVLMAIAAVNVLLKIILNASLLPVLGVAGVALSTSIVYVFALGCCWFFAYAALAQEQERDMERQK